MKIVKLIVVIAGIMAALAMADSDPCPEGTNGVYMGMYNQQQCEDNPGYCSYLLHFFLWSRACAWWCCYDADGSPVAVILDPCGPWSLMPEQCCPDQTPPTLPNCPGGS